MNALIVLAAALGLVGSAAAAELPARAPDYTGKFEMSYTPIYCVRAPCPPGNYNARSIDGRRLASVKTVQIDPAADAALRDVFNSRAYFEGIAVEGDIWIDTEAGAVHIRPARATAGAWKTEFPDPAPDAGQAEATISLTIVNKTRDVVRGVYVAPARADHWGADRLDNQNLSINQRIAITLPTADCLYDVRIVLGQRPAEEIRRHNVCESPVLTADRSGQIIDRSR